MKPVIFNSSFFNKHTLWFELGWGAFTNLRVLVFQRASPCCYDRRFATWNEINIAAVREFRVKHKEYRKCS